MSKAPRTLGVKASVFRVALRAARQLVLISAAWRQKHASRGLELALFFDG